MTCYDMRIMPLCVVAHAEPRRLAHIAQETGIIMQRRFFAEITRAQSVYSTAICSRFLTMRCATLVLLVEQVNSMKDGEVILLENVRFYKQETKNDPEFAKVTCHLLLLTTYCCYCYHHYHC
jgi:Phosphoglycerate kinase